MAVCTLRTGLPHVCRRLFSVVSMPVSHMPYRYQHSMPHMDDDERSKFSALAGHWWSETGEFKALHSLNRLRIPLIRDSLINVSSWDKMVSKPLLGKRILDIGCGGGLICEPLARLGATVVGVDPLGENIRVAETHLELSSKEIQDRVRYQHCSAEDLVSGETASFDCVVASEVLEHVHSWEALVATASLLTKPGGTVIATTINRTQASYWLAVVAAEQVCGIVPKGTHDWNKFITPDELTHCLVRNQLRTELIHGMLYWPLSGRWSWISDTSINYAIKAVKTSQPTSSAN